VDLGGFEQRLVDRTGGQHWPVIVAYPAGSDNGFPFLPGPGGRYSRWNWMDVEMDGGENAFTKMVGCFINFFLIKSLDTFPPGTFFRPCNGRNRKEAACKARKPLFSPLETKGK
jgi:hypothetical protein